VKLEVTTDKADTHTDRLNFMRYGYAFKV